MTKKKPTTEGRLDALAERLRANPKLADRALAYLEDEARKEAERAERERLRGVGWTHVRIPNDLLADAERLGEELRALPAYAELGNNRGVATATIRLAVERGLAELRAELAKPRR